VIIIELFIGKWHDSYNPLKVYEFTDDGLFLVFSDWKSFVINTSEKLEKLTIGNEREPNQKQYVRKEVSPGGGIVGVWGNDIEGIYFKERAFSWTGYANPLEQELGTYEITGEHNDGVIRTRNVRSIYTINGNNIVFTPPWGTTDPGTYTFSNNDNTLTIKLASGSRIFQRTQD